MKVFVTRKIPQPGLDILRRECEIEVFPHDRIPKEEEIIKGVKGKDGLLCLLTDPITKKVINAEPKLKMISSYAVGYDNIDVKEATKRGIPVSNTPGVLTDATAEMTWALLFSVARRIVEGDKFTRDGKFNGWSPMLMLGQDISNRTLGIIGAGRIGTSVALKSKGFNMNVLYHSNKTNEVLEKKLRAKKVELDELLKQSDFITIHVPLTPSTHYLIGERELKIMKKTVILINTSRGPVVDEKALSKALKQNWIFGAGLDVYENEPSVDKDLIGLDNVILQPHSASATTGSRTKMAVMAAENMICGLKDKIPPDCINVGVFK